MDRNGNIEEKPASMAFTIALPWYKETRLVLISLAGMIVALFFAALAFNRHRKLLKSYAEVERKVAERTHELEITSRELVHSQKMNALGTLAAGIAHDFNNILSIIKGSAQIIEDNVDNSEKVRTRVDRIKTVVEQGAGIVRAMLGFSGGSSDEPALCDLNTVVGDTIQLLGDRFQRDAAVLFKPEPGLPQVAVVKEFVQQILLNFIFNAAEAETAAKQKQIILMLRAVQRPPESLALAPAPAREYIVVSVQDFGCGIPPENLPRIFEPFFTTKALSARRGTGLGLSMVYELARKLEAGLSVESIVNVGSMFMLILPVRDLKVYEKEK
jgi:signal transduction histidine kinase